MEYQTVLVEKNKGIAKIILNLPDKLNPLDLVMREELKDIFFDLRQDPRSKVIVITGAGRAFSAGSDVRTMEGIEAPAARDRLKNVQQLVKQMAEIEKPIIAAVNGVAAGAGFGITLLSDIAVASEKARFSLAFSKLGLIPDMGVFYFLPLRVGIHKAKELMFSGRIIDVNEAKELGLINKVVPHEELENEVMTLAESLAKGPSRSYAMTKSALNSLPAPLHTMLELEANMQSVAFATRDFDEGRRSFLEKREAQFTGE